MLTKPEWLQSNYFEADSTLFHSNGINDTLSLSWHSSGNPAVPPASLYKTIDNNSVSQILQCQISERDGTFSNAYWAWAAEALFVTHRETFRASWAGLSWENTSFRTCWIFGLFYESISWSSCRQQFGVATRVSPSKLQLPPLIPSVISFAGQML